MKRKSVLITGSASGIGRQTAIAFKNKGFFVGFSNTATINLSTSLLPLSNISICPFVTGSKLPGQIPIRTIIPLPEWHG